MIVKKKKKKELRPQLSVLMAVCRSHSSDGECISQENAREMNENVFSRHYTGLKVSLNLNLHNTEKQLLLYEHYNCCIFPHQACSILRPPLPSVLTPGGQLFWNIS